MDASKEIDNLISQHQDWRGEKLSELRKIILNADPEIVEEWKYMGSPVWYRKGMICVGNIFKDKVKLIFANGAALADPDKVFNADLSGNQRRAIEWYEGDRVDAKKLMSLVRSAIEFNLKSK